ncbi:MAG: hypothetical protein CMH86_11265 [Oceanibulbus sp.]|nr:hypothetical protein [Sulfitobacter sp.]
MPPWWLLSSPQAAALINVTPATLHIWRTRGEGPATVPPLFLKPAQGDPIFHMYGILRKWAAKRVGLDYQFEDQCWDYFRKDCPMLVDGVGSMAARAREFDRQYEAARQEVGQGDEPRWVSLSTIRRLDPYYARQPKWRRLLAKYNWDCG